MKYFLPSLLCLTISFYSCQETPRTQAERIESSIDSIINTMNLAEKVGQMTLYTSDYDVTGPSVREAYIEDIKAGHVGAIFNAFTAEFTKELQELAVEESRLGIPLIFGYDVIHGHRTIFPIPLGESASWDLDAIRLSARIAAKEASAEGLHWTFAPMVDIARDPRWGRIAEGSGEDVYLTKKIARARVEGFQGDDLSHLNTIMACAKHFAAYGAAQAGRDYHTVDISEQVLRSVYLPPFKAAEEAGAATFMTAFNELFGVPASASEFLLEDILKEEWGFNGFVVTDYTSINEMVAHGYSVDEKDAARQAVNAGVDMDMQGGTFQNYLIELVQEGKVQESRIDDAVRRILRKKFELGLMEDPYRYSDRQRQADSVLTTENLEIARDVARKSIVLLKNNDNILPLDKSTRNIAVIGPLADARREMIGSWSAAGDFNKAITLLQGIKNKLPEANIRFAKGSNIDDDSTGFINEAVQLARRSDVVVLALGEAALMSGEAASRSNIDLPGVQLELAKRIYETGKPVVVVLMNGRPLTIPWLDAHVPAILETWFLGTQAGNAIADVLFGDYNPSGKLPVTFPRSVGQIPIFYASKNTGRPLIEEQKYTSKYLDIPNTPLYPFGYGLSYTNFAYSNLALNKASISMSDTLSVSIELTNSGEVAGTEIVQLYIRDLVADVTRPVKELRGFEKVTLQPGESTTVHFQLTQQDLAYYNQNLELVTDTGEFTVYVGGNSRDVLEASFSIDNDRPEAP